MSRTVELCPPVCDYCGGFIQDRDQQCPARDDVELPETNADPLLEKSVVERVDEQAQRLWHSQDWDSLFQPPEPRFLFRQGEKTSVPARIPDEFFDREARHLWENTDWDTIVNPLSPHKRYLDRRQRSVVIPVTMLPVADDYLREIVSSLAKDNPPDPPPTGFDDVQYHVCGKYWYKEEEKEYCSCGEKVDFLWNKHTGRISELPDWL